MTPEFCPHCGTPVFFVASKVSSKRFPFDTAPSRYGDAVLTATGPRWAERRDTGPWLRLHSCPTLFGGDAA